VWPVQVNWLVMLIVMAAHAPASWRATAWRAHRFVLRSVFGADVDRL
jgi:hypothetical protein